MHMLFSLLRLHRVQTQSRPKKNTKNTERRKHGFPKE